MHEAARRNRRARFVPRYLASLAQLDGEWAHRGCGRDISGAARATSHGGQRFQREHIQVPRGSKRARQPFDLGDQAGQLVRCRQIAQQRQASAKAARSNAHLMDPLGIVVVHDSVCIALDLAQTNPNDRCQYIAGRSIRRQFRVLRAHRCSGSRRHQTYAARSLAGRFERQRQIARQRESELEQTRNVA